MPGGYLCSTSGTRVRPFGIEMVAQLAHYHRMLGVFQQIA
jgi:hypothetical protein